MKPVLQDEGGRENYKFIVFWEWIQNSDLQNGEITKQRMLQNSDCYKKATVTKRQKIIQNKSSKFFNKKSTVLGST